MTSPPDAPLSRPDRTLLVGCGKLGSHLGAQLVRESGVVYGLRRTADAVPDGVIPIEADLASDEPFRLPDVDALVITLPPLPAEGGGYRRALQRVRDGLPELPRRTIFVSSTGVFEGWGRGQPITEGDVPRPASPRSLGLRDGELAAVELFDATIVRPAGIYGPGREFLIRTVREGRAVDYERATNRIHEVDLVRALRALLSVAEPPPVVHAVDSGPSPLGEVVTYIGQLSGRTPPPRAESAGPTGNIFTNDGLLRLVGALRHPDFRSGYREMIDGAAPGRTS